MLKSPPADAELQAIYAGSNSQDPLVGNAQSFSSLTELEAAKTYVKALKNKAPGSKMLLLAPGGHPFTTEVGQQGFEIETIFSIRELERKPLPKDHYDCAVVIFQLEKSANPIQTLEQIGSALKPNALLFLLTPSMDSWSARFLRGQWTEWRNDNFFYFDKQTIQSALLRSGFAQIEVSRDRRRYSLQHLYDRARTSPQTFLTSLVRAVCRPLPSRMRHNVRIRLSGSGILVTARRASRRKRPLLSIVMPVYNELATFAKTMGGVIAKEVPGIDKEIIIVESNSSDGTRDAVLGYQGFRVGYQTDKKRLCPLRDPSELSCKVL